MAPDAVSRVPNEILNEIRSYLPQLFKHLPSRVWRVEPTPNDKHSALWNLIFANEDWLFKVTKTGAIPVLVGKDLHKLYNANMVDSKKSKYLALVLGCDGDGGTMKPNGVEEFRRLFNSSLQPYITERKGEITFPDSGLTINVSDCFTTHHYTTVSQPGRLVSRNLTGLHSAYLY
jgi:hypothetical protein